MVDTSNQSVPEMAIDQITQGIKRSFVLKPLVLGYHSRKPPCVPKLPAAQGDTWVVSWEMGLESGHNLPGT